eukprot:140172-Amphidinium_carterae.1
MQDVTFTVLAKKCNFDLWRVSFWLLCLGVFGMQDRCAQRAQVREREKDSRIFTCCNAVQKVLEFKTR